MPDIQYLLFLQNLREMTGGFFDEIFNSISKLAVDVFIYIPFLIYWAVDKEWGKRFIGIAHGSEFVNALIKLTVCAYRPWIRSDLINPAGDSKVAATGYSFPSGHTNRATAHLGTLALWQYKKRRWLAILCAVGILLVGFSRNFLGVHTPQDVIVSFLVSVIMIFAISKFQKAVEGKDKLVDILTVVGLFVIVLAIIYVSFKPYPLDYDSNGKLLVNPSKMMNDGFKVFGSLSAFIIGLYIDRHFIHYEIPVGHKNLPVLAAVGIGIFFSWKNYFGKATFIEWFGGHWGNFIAYFLSTFFALVIFPLVIRKFTQEEE